MLAGSRGAIMGAINISMVVASGVGVQTDGAATMAIIRIA